MSPAPCGIRGFIDAWTSIPAGALAFLHGCGPRDPGARTAAGRCALRGGGSIWVTGTCDPEQNLVFFGTATLVPTTMATRARATTSTPRRSWRSMPTPAAALALSVHAARRTTGFDPVPVLGELTINGQARKVVMFANRNGFFYTSIASPAKDRRQAVCRDDVGANRCDRTSDAVGGPTPDEVGNKTCPDLGGGTNHVAVLRSDDEAVFRDRARDLRDVPAYDQKFKPGEQYWRWAVAAARSEELRRVARDRPDDGADQMGVPLRRCRGRAC